MFDLKDNVENIAGDVEGIVKDYYKLTVVNAVEKGSKLGANFILNGILVALTFFALLFALFGVSYWIGQTLGNPMLGFFIVAGFLFLILFILIALKGKIIIPMLRNIIIKNIYD